MTTSPVKVAAVASGSVMAATRTVRGRPSDVVRYTGLPIRRPLSSANALLTMAPSPPRRGMTASEPWL